MKCSIDDCDRLSISRVCRPLRPLAQTRNNRPHPVGRQTSLAHEYGVHIPAISRIVHRKRWGYTDPTDTKQLTTESSTT